MPLKNARNFPGEEIPLFFVRRSSLLRRETVPAPSEDRFLNGIPFAQLGQKKDIG
jgi:hypothetical protein